MNKRGLGIFTTVLVIVVVLIVGTLIYNSTREESLFSPRFFPSLNAEKSIQEKPIRVLCPQTSASCTSKGSTICSSVGNGVQTCVADSNGCLSWSGPVACTSTSICQNGACVAGNETNQTHSICSGNSCIAVQGAGINECIFSSDCVAGNETNQTFPDLIISSMNYYIDNSTNGTFENKTVYVYTTVKNIGEATAPSSLLRLYLSPFGNVNTITVSSLMPNQAQTKTTVYSYLPSGVFSIVNATADYNNQVSESNEYNNYGAVSFWT